MIALTFLFLNAWIAFIITAIWYHITKAEPETDPKDKTKAIYSKHLNKGYHNNLN